MILHFSSPLIVYLPWVTSTKNLDCTIHNNENGMVCDLMEKRAAYINKNNELMQEFGFAHSDTMIKINNIFNTALYGSVLWDLFGKEAKRLEKNIERFTTSNASAAAVAQWLRASIFRQICMSTFEWRGFESRWCLSVGI